MSGARVVHETITLRELADGWLWVERGTTYGTAVGAARAVKRRGRAVAASGARHVAVINWEVTSIIGRAVVRAITDSKE